MIEVKDRPGVIAVATMRDYFEKAIRHTPVFAGNTPLGIMEVNGQFSHYASPETDTMWLGFVLGMRCAERIARSRAPEPANG